MSNYLISKVTLSVLGLLSVSAFADSNKSEYYTVEGSHSASFPLKNKSLETNSFDIESLTGIKTIQLMTITTSESFKEKNRTAIQEMATNGGELDYRNGITPFTNSATSVDLGMGNVPVLDQGAHGTCVTFAATAALNAKIKQGDYIDQQCSLALNKFLGHNYWNGAYTAVQILEPLKKYGIIPKNQCFGKKYADTSQKINPIQYMIKSDKSYAGQITYHYTEKASADVVKATLKAGYRVAIGTALADTSDPISVNGFDVKIKGTSGSYDGGLWACKQPGNSTNYCADQNAGHEVVIIGYDDEQQLFKIRNSWGTYAGEKGNYYMSYDFFNAMVMDHTELK